MSITLQRPESLIRCPPMNFSEMEKEMRLCEQTQGQSVLAHGELVWSHMLALLQYLRGAPLSVDSWRLPAWLDGYKVQILSQLHDEKIMRLYAIYHDCGKPFCRHVDEKTGQAHFPDHARVSEYVWSCVGGDETVGHLIGDDMVIHVATAEEIGGKLSGDWSVADSLTLLIAALAEIHSNARMFGGLASTSFKMKWKTVDRRGNQILKFWPPSGQTVQAMSNCVLASGN